MASVGGRKPTKCWTGQLTDGIEHFPFGACLACVRVRGPRFVQYNGGVGAKQLLWLEDELRAASRAGQRVVGFGHVPIHPGDPPSHTLIWNYQEVRSYAYAYPYTHAYAYAYAYAYAVCLCTRACVFVVALSRWHITEIMARRGRIAEGGLF